MITKILGYVLAVGGILGLAGATFPFFRSALALPAALSTGVLMSVSLIVVVVGGVLVYLAGNGGTKKGTEVPIYEGKKVVGYRRI